MLAAPHDLSHGEQGISVKGKARAVTTEVSQENGLKAVSHLKCPLCVCAFEGERAR